MSDIPTEIELKAALKASLDWWADMGVDRPDLPPSHPPAPATTHLQSSTKQRPKPSTTAQDKARVNHPTDTDMSKRQILAENIAKAAPTLEALYKAISDFDAGILSDYARQAVTHRGNPKADIMVIGEAPGQMEDEQGRPFVGPAGQLLDKMFASINLDENALYITNVCNWRPPHNRNPSEDELAMCQPFITRHMELIAPKMIVIVGGVSLQALTGRTGIMKARGQWLELDIGGQKIPAMPLYHPAFLLRRPELKKHAWRDLLAIKAKLTTT